MNERLLRIRKELKYSQEKFGKALGITGAAVSRLESGERAITESTIKLICSTFNVSETWLRTGEGEMFNTNRDSELAYLMGALFAEGNEFKKSFITQMLKLDSESWAMIEDFIDKLILERKTKDTYDDNQN